MTSGARGGAQTTHLVLAREHSVRTVLAQILPIEASRGRRMKEGIRYEEA